MNANRLPALALSATLTVVLLAACSNAQDQTAPTPATPQVVATSEAPAPVETEAPCTVPTPGTTVTTMDDIYCAEDAGLIAYRLDTGAVIIDPAAGEIPAEVQKEMAAPVAQAIADEATGASVPLAARAAAESTAAALGRPAVVIASMRAADGIVFTATASVKDQDVRTSLGHAAVSSSHDDTVSKAKAWIASQSNAAEWVIIDATL